MKERKQYIGKPQIYKTLTQLESNISALERAGLTVSTKVIHKNAPPRKTPPLPVPHEVAPPVIIPIGITRPSYMFVWDASDDAPSMPGPTDDVVLNNGTMMKFVDSAWVDVNSTGLPIFNYTGAHAPFIQSLTSNGDHIWFIIRRLIDAFTPKYEIYHGLSTGGSYELVFSGEDSTADDVPLFLATDAIGRILTLCTNNDAQMSLYRSDDGITDWAKISDVSVPYMEPYYQSWFGSNFAIATHPTNKNIIAVRANSFDLDAENLFIFVSLDAGLTWTSYQLTVAGEIFHYSDGDIVICADGTIVVQDSVEYNDGDYHRSVYCWYMTLDGGTYNAPVRTDPTPALNDDDFGQVSRLAVSENTVFHLTWKDHYTGNPIPFPLPGWTDIVWVTQLCRSDDSGHTWSLVTDWTYSSLIHTIPADYDTLPGYPAGMHYNPSTDELWVIFIGGPNDIDDNLQPRLWLVQSDGSKAHTTVGSISNGFGDLMGPSS